MHGLQNCEAIMKPQPNKTHDQFTQDELDLIAETYNNVKVIGSAQVNGYEVKYLADGGEVILDPDGNELNEWPDNK